MNSESGHVCRVGTGNEHPHPDIKMSGRALGEGYSARYHDRIYPR